MYHFNFKRFIITCSLFFVLALVLSNSISIQSNAMEVTYYSHDDIVKLLPKKYNTSTYFYEENGKYYLSFATYNGNNFRTTIKNKKGTDNLLYCVNYNNSILFNKSYAKKNNLFNNELRVRLGIAFHYAPVQWGDKANKKFTTGNEILDYYMTQIVVHSLINKYGGDKSNYGIDYSKVVFKSNTDDLSKKTKEFFEYCCNAKVEYNDGNFQDAKFSFVKPEDKNLYLQGSNFISSDVTCTISNNNATVSSYTRSVEEVPSIDPKQIVFNEATQSYNSAFSISIPSSAVPALLPGVYKVKVSEDVTFDRKLAGFWQCDEEGYENSNQQVGGQISEAKDVSDSITFKLLVGELFLYKIDSITDELIHDAAFDILAYNSTTKSYEYYKSMTYNTTHKRYESGNLYLSLTNKEGKFKVIEKSPGANYINDWAGQEFVINSNTQMHEIHVENQPILGKLNIKKTGNTWSFSAGKFQNATSIPLPKIKFALYAKENIYAKGKLLYAKDKKIVDLITDQNGTAKVDNLPMGVYYIQEILTYDSYILDSTIHEFKITRDSTRKYSEANFTVHNKLKTCQIELFKYYYDKHDKEKTKKIPLMNAKFGLYLNEDLCDIHGNVIVKKDTFIQSAYSDKQGNIVFNNLPYAEYYVKELEAPDSFVINDGIIPITKADFTYDEKKQCYVFTHDIINQKQSFSIKVLKKGDAFIGYKEEKAEYGSFYSYQIGEKTLEQVTFSLYTMEKELVDTQTTDVNGVAEFKNLEAGKYYLVEQSAPEEYTIVETSRDVTCEMDNTEYNVFSKPVFEENFYDELCEVSLQFTKYGEKAVVEDKELKYQQIPLSNVIFGIYQNFDYTFSDNASVLKKGSCIGYILTDKNGIGTYSGKLPCGEYYIKELNTNPGYDLDTKEYLFTVQPNKNQVITVQLDNNNIFYNLLSKSSVQINKTDAETGKKLKNVEFTLYNELDEVIGVYKTDKKGKIIVENLPYGKYYFIETKCKDGYYSTNNKYHFTLNSEEKITLDITNSPILELGFEENYSIWLIGIGCVLSIFILFVFLDYKILKPGRK